MCRKIMCRISCAGKCLGTPTLRTRREFYGNFYHTYSVVIWFSTDTLGIFATLVYVFTMRVVIYDILSMAMIPTLHGENRGFEVGTNYVKV